MDDFECIMFLSLLLAIGGAIGVAFSAGPSDVYAGCNTQGYYNVDSTRVILCGEMKK